jgi:hypothetical protein
MSPFKTEDAGLVPSETKVPDVRFEQPLQSATSLASSTNRKLSGITCPATSRPSLFPPADAFFTSHDWATALRCTLAPQPTPKFSLPRHFASHSQRSATQTNITSRSAGNINVEILLDQATENSSKPFPFVPPCIPLVPNYPRSDDGLRPLRPGKRLTFQQEEARWYARRAQAAAETVEESEEDDDDKDWNKENERKCYPNEVREEEIEPVEIVGE